MMSTMTVIEPAETLSASADLGGRDFVELTRERSPEETTQDDFWTRLTLMESPRAVMSHVSIVGGAADGPPLTVPAPHAQFTADIRRLSLILRAIILTKSYRAGLAIESMELSVDYDEEEGDAHVVMLVRVNASTSQTLGFWNSLGYEIGRWMDQLTLRDRETVANGLSLRFAGKRRARAK